MWTAGWRAIGAGAFVSAAFCSASCVEDAVGRERLFGRLRGSRPAFAAPTAPGSGAAALNAQAPPSAAGAKQGPAPAETARIGGSAEAAARPLAAGNPVDAASRAAAVASTAADAPRTATRGTSTSSQGSSSSKPQGAGAALHSPAAERRRAADAKILEALSQPLEEESLDISLDGLAERLHRELGVPTVVDETQLHGEDLVTIQGRGLPWIDALELALGAIHAEVGFARGTLYFHRGPCPADLATEFFDVFDLRAEPVAAFDVESLRVAPLPMLLLEHVGGDRGEREDERRFSISTISDQGCELLAATHRFRERRRIAELLGDLAACGGATPRSPKIPRATEVRRIVEARIEKGLDSPLHEDWLEVPIRELLARIGRRLDAPTNFDPDELKHGGHVSDDRVSVHGRGLLLRDALQAALAPIKLRVEARHGVVHFTSTEAPLDSESRFFSSECYDVLDLVRRRTPEGDVYWNFDELLEPLRACVGEPESWSSGGLGMVSLHRDDRRAVLVVRQTPEGHRRIGCFLNDLRAALAAASPRRPTDVAASSASAAASSADGARPKDEVSQTKDESDPVKFSATELRAARDAAADAFNHAGGTLFAEASRPEARDLPRNFVLSSWTAAAGLAPLAAGDQSKRLRELLPWAGRAEDFPMGARALRSRLPFAEGEDGCELHTASRLWSASESDDAESLRIFAPWMHEPSKPVRLDFARPVDAAAQVNQWFRRETKGKLREVLQAGELDPRQEVLWTTADVLEAPWRTPFFPEATAPAEFRIFENAVSVPMMQIEGRFVYGLRDGVHLLRMPLGRFVHPKPEHGLEMVLLLPENDPAALRDLVEATAKGDLQTHLDAASARKVEVRLPKFSVRSKIDLRTTLERLGLTGLRLPGFPKAGVSNLVQEAVVAVDEGGVQAAAAQSGGFFGGPPERPLPPARFIADRPFVFVVRDARTRLVLYLGQVVDPRSGGGNWPAP